MCFKPRPVLLAALAATLSGPVAADNLGFRFAEVSLNVASDGTAGHGGALLSGGFPGGNLQTGARVSADFAITANHGLQFDASAVSYGGEYLGQIDGHLYMMPTEAAKYGLFFSLADVDGREATIAMLGIEGMFALSDRTILQGRAGLGMAMPGNSEFITASLGVSHAFNQSVAVFADLTLAEFDEAAFRAIGTTLRLGVSYQPAGRPWEISAAVLHDGLTGRDAAAFETRAEMGFTWHLGAGGGAARGLAARAFTSPQPFDAVLRRGLF